MLGQLGGWPVVDSRSDSLTTGNGCIRDFLSAQAGRRPVSIVTSLSDP